MPKMLNMYRILMEWVLINSNTMTKCKCNSNNNSNNNSFINNNHCICRNILNNNFINNRGIINKD